MVIVAGRYRRNGGETIVDHLRDYSIDYIRTRCLDVINNQYKTVSQQAKKREWPVSVLVLSRNTASFSPILR